VTFTRHLRRALEHRSSPLLVALVAFVLTLPTLRAGLIADDYLHRMVLLHKGAWGAAMNPVSDLFAFVPTKLAAWMRDVGYLPWWADPKIHIAFARPLTALTHVLDYALWPDTPALQHLQSLLWFALGVGLVALLYRKLHASAAVAGMASLLFALEDSHVVVAGWLANRNAALCLVCGAGLLLLHIEWRRTRAARYGLLALLALAVGLGCGEAMLGAVAYVVAWQLTCETGSWRRRLTPLLSYGALIALWRVLYVAFGYGTEGSWLYVDPGAHPWLFLVNVTERWPLLLGAQWLQAPANLWLALSRQAQIASSAICAALLVGVAALLFRLLRRDALARFWALGMAASLVPVCASFPMDRLLLFAGVGAFGLMAMFFESCGVWPWGPVRDRWRRRAAVVLLVLHGPVAAMMTVLGSLLLPLLGGPPRAAAELAPRGPEVSSQTFVFVNGNDFPVVYMHVIRTATGEAPAPRRMALLAPLLTTSLVRREDANTLVITPLGGYLALSIDRLLASPTRRFFAGEIVDRPDYRAEVRSLTADGRPFEVAFRFRMPLEDPQLRWLSWQHGELGAFALPGIGESVTLRASPLIH